MGIFKRKPKETAGKKQTSTDHLKEIAELMGKKEQTNLFSFRFAVPVIARFARSDW